MEFDIDDGWIIVRDLQTPTGWSPDNIDMRLELENYPENPPFVYVTEELQYEGSRPQIVMPPSSDPEEEWCQLDVEFGKTYEWQSDFTIRTVVEVAIKALESIGKPPGWVEDGDDSTSDSASEEPSTDSPNETTDGTDTENSDPD